MDGSGGPIRRFRFRHILHITSTPGAGAGGGRWELYEIVVLSQLSGKESVGLDVTYYRYLVHDDTDKHETNNHTYV